MSPHCSAIFLQHSRSAAVIAAFAAAQVNSGSANRVHARAQMPTLLRSFNQSSLPPVMIGRNRRQKISDYCGYAISNPTFIVMP